MSSTKLASPLLAVAPVQRAAAYVRVSTNRQAEHETSLADQVAAITAYCEARSIELTEVFREPGASATDDNRPQFQALIETALGMANVESIAPTCDPAANCLPVLSP